jgi:uncharacterized paraquat-inducible protein A
MTVTATPTAAWAPGRTRDLTDARHHLGGVHQACVAVEPTCVCGQPLDCSHTAHCPRCGVTLHG